ncbi:MAG: dTMP kinase [Lachnospiraceae bacterium]|nr:dTMP kinase [Lachnospiraceae bacterium]
MTENKRGAFIAFEGIDGSGKGTQIRMLKKRLEKEGFPVYRTAEPNDSPFGDLIHQVMIGRVKTTNDVIAALFVADRLDHIQNDTNGLLKFLNQGVNVLADRYYFSSYAYQSVDVPMDWVIQANSLCAALLRPDLTVFIDVDPEVTMARIEKNRLTKELFEETERQIDTRNRYLEAFEKLKDSEHVLILNGDRSPEELHEEIWEKTKAYYVKGLR